MAGKLGKWKIKKKKSSGTYTQPRAAKKANRKAGRALKKEARQRKRAERKKSRKK